MTQPMSQSATDPKHVDRILKCLRLAESASYNPNEAANAMRKAMELAAMYQIDLAAVQAASQQVRPEDVKFEVVKEAGAEDFHRMNRWKINIGHVLECLFGIKFYISNSGREKMLYYIGTKEDVALSKEVFQIIQRMAYKYSREMYGSKFRKDHRSFCSGFVDGLYFKAKEMKRAADAERAAAKQANQTGTSIVLWNKDNQVAAYYADISKNFTTLKSRQRISNGTAYAFGQMQGQKTNLNFKGAVSAAA